MKCFIGIDLGSTTTKAMVLDEDCNVMGRGITNSRSNYDIAAAHAKDEALVDTRFNLFRESLAAVPEVSDRLDDFVGRLEQGFRLELHAGEDVGCGKRVVDCGDHSARQFSGRRLSRLPCIEQLAQMPVQKQEETF